jgi:beta-lactamase class A
MKRLFVGFAITALSASDVIDAPWRASAGIQLWTARLHAQAQTPLQRLQASIERTTRSINATWGIFVKSLETGEEIAIDAERQMETMSTIKIPLMVEVFEQIKAGKFKLTDKYTFVQADSQPGTGTIQRLDPGAVMTVKDLITMMIIVSDNTATEVLYRMVGGPEAVNARMDTLGLKRIRAMNVPSKWFPALRAAPATEQFYREGKHPFGLSTPREMGALLEMMERGTLVDKPSSDLMLRIMRAQLYRTRIPRYVTGYTIPHKTGDFLPYVGDDVGMMEAPGRTIVISIFTGNHFGSGDALENAIGLVAKDVADYFSYRQ